MAIGWKKAAAITLCAALMVLVSFANNVAKAIGSAAEQSPSGRPNNNYHSRPIVHPVVTTSDAQTIETHAPMLQSSHPEVTVQESERKQSTVERSAEETRDLLLKLGVPTCAIDYFEANYKALEQNTSTAVERQRCQHSLQGTGVHHAYMIHYTPMRARRKAMQELLDQHGVDVHWVLGFDKEALTPEIVTCFQTWQPSMFKDRFPMKAKRHDQLPAPKLKMSQVSVVVKHHSALYDAVRRNYHHAMVLEDDALLRNGFKWQLKETMEEARTTPSAADWDVMMIGGCMRMHAYRRKFQAKRLSKHHFEKQEARCAHAFVVTQRGAQYLLAGIPLTLPIDFQFTRAMKESQLKCLWVEPFLSQQGIVGGSGCVTNELGKGVKCVSIEKYDRNFDLRYHNNTKWAVENWNRIPEPGQK